MCSLTSASTLEEWVTRQSVHVWRRVCVPVVVYFVHDAYRVRNLWRSQFLFPVYFENKRTNPNNWNGNSLSHFSPDIVRKQSSIHFFFVIWHINRQELHKSRMTNQMVQNERLKTMPPAVSDRLFQRYCKRKRNNMATSGGKSNSSFQQKKTCKLTPLIKKRSRKQACSSLIIAKFCLWHHSKTGAVLLPLISIPPEWQRKITTRKLEYRNTISLNE